MTHTKGPWKRQSYRIFASQLANAEYPIHAPKKGLIAKAFRESDANLISAAPDLLECLMDYEAKTEAEIQAVIAKATGAA